MFFFANLSGLYEKSSKKGEKILRESDQILKNLLISLIFYLLQSLQSFFVISRSPVQVRPVAPKRTTPKMASFFLCYGGLEPRPAKRAPAKILLLPCRGSRRDTANKGKRKIFVGKGATDEKVKAFAERGTLDGASRCDAVAGSSPATRFATENVYSIKVKI